MYSCVSGGSSECVCIVCSNWGLVGMILCVCVCVCVCVEVFMCGQCLFVCARFSWCIVVVSFECCLGDVGCEVICV